MENWRNCSHSSHNFSPLQPEVCVHRKCRSRLPECCYKKFQINFRKFNINLKKKHENDGRIIMTIKHYFWKLIFGKVVVIYLGLACNVVYL